MDQEDFQIFTSIRYDPQLDKSRAFGFELPCAFYMLSHHRNRLSEAASHFGWHKVWEILQDGLKLQKSLEEQIEYFAESSGFPGGPLKVKIVFSQDGQMSTEIVGAEPTTMEHLYPSTLDLPPDDDLEVNKAKPVSVFEPSPLTGGALLAGPTAPAVNQSADTQLSGSFTTVKPSYLLTVDDRPTTPTPHLSLKTTYRPHYDDSRARCLSTVHSLPGLANKEVLLYNERNQVMEGSLTTAYFYRSGRWVTPPLGLEHGGQWGTTRRWALENGLCEEEEVLIDSLRDGERVWVSNGVRGFNWGYLVLRPSA